MQTQSSSAAGVAWRDFDPAGPATGEMAVPEYAVGERALMSAVLADAVVCLSEWRCRPRLAHEARGWVESTCREWPFSFANLCDMLGFDPDCLRRRLLTDVPPLSALRHMRPPSKGRPSRNRVSWACSPLGLAARARRDAAIVRRREQGWNLKAIAESFGLTEGYVHTICARPRPVAESHESHAAEAVRQTV